MGLLTQYFTAPTDDAAAAVDGSSIPPGALDGGGVEPAVHLGTLEALLTGRTVEEVLDGAATAPVAEHDEGAELVLRVTDELTRVLAGTGGDRLDEVAVPWSRTEELQGSYPAVLAAFARGLSVLARRAHDDGGHVYCWLGV